jgi:hypothetical protein
LLETGGLNKSVLMNYIVTKIFFISRKLSQEEYENSFSVLETIELNLQVKLTKSANDGLNIANLGIVTTLANDYTVETGLHP